MDWGEPTPRLEYEGDKHPATGQRVFRQDVAGYLAAFKDIARDHPSHSCLEAIKERINEITKGSAT